MEEKTGLKRITFNNANNKTKYMLCYPTQLYFLGACAPWLKFYTPFMTMIAGLEHSKVKSIAVLIFNMFK